MLLMSGILQVCPLHPYHFHLSFPITLHAPLSHTAIIPAPPVSYALLIQLGVISLHKRRRNGGMLSSPTTSCVGAEKMKPNSFGVVQGKDER